MFGKPKILFILQLPPPVHGSSMLGRYIKESKLITGAFECRFINSSFSRDMSDLGVLSFKKVIIFFSILFQTLKYLTVFRPNICYIAPTAKGIGFYKDFPIIFLIKLFRNKTVLHFHNKGVLQKQDKWLDDKLYKFVFHGSKVILLSPRLYMDVQKYVDENNVFICPNGIAEQKIDIKKILNTPVRLLFLSNMMVAKGVYDLVDACAILKQKGLAFQCDFVGKWADISEREFINKIKEKNLNKVVFGHGAKYGYEKDICFENADIFVFPTRYETFGLVNIEAMQYGLPVISTNEGGIPDIVEDGISGFIVEKQNPEMLAAKIEELINNSELRINMGVAGQKKFKENYTLEIFEKRMCEILHEIL